MEDAAKLRDRFRDIESEACDLAECFDPDINGMADAAQSISSALDQMSGPV